MAELIRGLHNLRERHLGCVATIGSFDGVHRGHQRILAQVFAQSQRLALPSLVMFFEPQPYEFFSAEKAPARLMRLREKAAALFALGVDRVLVIPFNQRLRSMTAQQFIDQVLVEALGVKYLVVGDDFRFGCDRSGDFALLQQAGRDKGFEVNNTHTFEIDGQRVSSTRIRACLEAGELDKAAELLSRPYTICGHVVQGQQLGRQLGVPTANVNLKRYRSPLSGVFAVKVELQGKRYPGVANVGVRPTVVGDPKPLLEVHLFDFDRDIYGALITVEFCKKIREEKKFSGLEELKANIGNDIAQAKAFFTQQG